MKRILWFMALLIFLLSMVGAKVVARSPENGLAPTPFDSLHTVTVYRL
ncbi:MAG: hypothetical protein ACT4P8_06385 [Betaproteobacteria bacterium]